VVVGPSRHQRVALLHELRASRTNTN
jgi:hypothetical protein